MFRLIEPSSGQIQIIVLAHSVSVHYNVHSLMMAERAETCRRMLILITNICCVY
jgi:hypothetical protein